MRRLGIPLAILALVAGACGDDDTGGTSATSPTTTTPAATSTTTTEPTTTTATTTTTTRPPTTTTSTTSTTTTTTTTEPEQPRAVGTLILGFFAWGEGAVIPPIPDFDVWLDLDLGTQKHSVEGDWTVMLGEEETIVDLDEIEEWDRVFFQIDFELELFPDTYEIEMIGTSYPGAIERKLVIPGSLEGWAGDMLQMSDIAGPEFTVSPTGCTYIGVLGFNYLRLPPGPLEQQQQMAREIAAEMDGGLLVIGTEAGSILPMDSELFLVQQDERPEIAQSCSTNGARWPGTPDPGPVPGDTLGDAVLQADTLGLIMLYEEALGGGCESVVSDTEVLDQGENTWTERWTMDRCGEPITYTITYTLTAGGGTDIGVHLDNP